MLQKVNTARNLEKIVLRSFDRMVQWDAGTEPHRGNSDRMDPRLFDNPVEPCPKSRRETFSLSMASLVACVVMPSERR